MYVGGEDKAVKEWVLYADAIKILTCTLEAVVRIFTIFCTGLYSLLTAIAW